MVEDYNTTRFIEYFIIPYFMNRFNYGTSYI